MIKIRPVTKKDRPKLAAILRNTPEFKPFEVIVAEEVIDSYLSDPEGSGYNIYIAEEDSVTIGYICYGPTPLTESTWDMYWMAVAPGNRGRGVGSELMTFAENQIRTNKGKLIIIETSSKPEYENTLRFHLKHGYQEICRIPDFYAHGDDKIILQKRLGA